MHFISKTNEKGKRLQLVTKNRKTFRKYSSLQNVFPVYILFFFDIFHVNLYVVLFVVIADYLAVFNKQLFNLFDKAL